MSKYWTFWCQIFLFTETFSLLCMSDPNVPKSSKACTGDQYGVQSEDGRIKCISCDMLPTCQHGLGLSVACGSIVSKKTHVQCVNCVLGQNFSALQDNKPCQRCQSLNCHLNEKVLGKCEVDKDTSKCTGICKKGFYSNAGSLDNCQPCSLCLNNDSTVVKKCKDDGMPIRKQCKMPTSTVPPVNKLSSTAKTGCKDQKYESQGYELYGHPAFFACMLIIILILALALAIVALWHRKRQRKTYSSVDTEEGQTPLQPPLNIIGNMDSGVGETDSVENQSEEAEVASLRQRKSSSGSGGQRVYFTRQHSNSNTGLEISDENLPNAEHSPNELQSDVFDDKEPTLQLSPRRKRTFSSSSGNKFPICFKRQNSNPIPEHENHKPRHKRRNTVTGFSNFSRILNGPTIRRREETTSLLSSTDDDFSTLIVPMPPKPTSFSGEKNQVFNQKDSNPIPEHMEEKDVSSTDENDNDILPQVVTLPSDTSSARHRLSGVKIGDLNAEVYRQLCNLLSLEIQNKDWQTLAGRMKYSNKQVKEFATPDKLLEHWGVKDGHDVACLIDLARDLERDDIVGLLESAESHPTHFYL